MEKKIEEDVKQNPIKNQLSLSCLDGYEITNLAKIQQIDESKIEHVYDFQ